MEIYKNLSLEDLDGEVWKEIEGYDGDYQISNLGRVKSFKCGKEIILSPHKNNRGYLRIKLCKNGESETKEIHILMYGTFIEKIPKGSVVHHIDFTTNNILENLQMMTKGEHIILHHTGLKRSEETKELMREKKKGEHNPNYGKDFSGENGPNHTLKEQDVTKIRIDLDEGILTQTEIGEKFGVYKSTISAIKNRRIWKHLK